MIRLMQIIFLCLSITSVFAGVLKNSKTDSASPSARTHIHPDLQDEKIVKADINENENSYWLEKAKNFVAEQVARPTNTNPAKNVIFFIGDGMSLTTLAATRVYMGGEEQFLSFEKFPYVGLAKTYCVNEQVPDSACTATSYLSGIKGNYGTINVDANVQRKDCDVNPDHRSYSIAKWAMDAGKSAGLVTTTRVTHASPAGVYASVAERDWENDNKVSKNCDKTLVDDIAIQLVYGDVGKNLKVILGGGRRQFRTPDMEDEESKSSKNKRMDGRNLIDEWLSLEEGRQYVWNRTELLNVDADNVGRLLGLFEVNHCLYNVDVNREEDHEEPSLSEMVEKAIDVLSADDKGYFLFVEGGKIDLAHHDNYAHIALDETAELSKAVEMARAKTSQDDTLIVVSSDHAHTMTYSGYATRGSNIFGTGGRSYEDNIPYMTLSYANGQGYYNFVNSTGGRVNPDDVDLTDQYLRFPALAPLDSETHGGDDVGIFASGPWAHLFTKTMEQNTFPHLLAYALCVGEGKTACSP